MRDSNKKVWSPRGSQATGKSVTLRLWSWSERIPPGELALVSAGYALLVVVALLSKGFALGQDTLGDGLSNPDWSGHMWSFWQASEWMRGNDALLSSELIFHPNGMSMGLIHGDFLTTRVAGLFWLIAGPQHGWALFVLFLLVGNGLGGTLLVGTVTGSRAAGLLGGLLLLFSGYGSWAVNTGNVEYASWLWTCLFLTFLVRLLRRPGTRDALFAGVFGAAAVLGNFVDGYHLPLFALCLLAWRVRRIGRAHVKALALTAGLAAVLLAPMGVVVALDHAGRPTHVEIDGGKAEGKSIVPEEPKYVPGAKLLDPREEAQVLEQYLPRPTIRRPFASGFLLAQLVLFGLGVSCGRWRALPWLGGAGVFALLCFGRDLSKLDPAFGPQIAMPFGWLEALVPFYDLVHHPIRLCSYCLIAWVVIVGLGVSRLISAGGPPWRLIPVWAVAVSVALQPFVGWYTRVVPVEAVSPFYRQLAAESGDGAVIAVPFTMYLADSAYLVDQTVHGRPIFNGCALQHVGGDPTHGLVARNAILAEIDRLQRGPLELRSAVMNAGVEHAAPRADTDLDLARRELVALGFHHLVLHKQVPFFHGTIRVGLDSPLAAFLHEVLGHPVYDDELLAAFDLRGEQVGEPDWDGRTAALRGIPLGEPARDGCAPFDSLTVLLDAHTVADEAYRAGGSPHGQPSIVLAVTEPDGREEAVVVDLGESVGAAVHNFDQWLARAGAPSGRRMPSATVISHLHTLRMFLPQPPGAKKPLVGPEEFSGALSRLAPGVIRGSNLDAFCQIATDASAVELCERPLVTLAPGLEALVWEDGRASDRVHLLTSPIDDHNLPFEPTETVLVVAAEPGYLVYSVCSHMPSRTAEDHLPPFHAVHQVRAAMLDGRLPEGPVHTLVTGGCGLEARAHAISQVGGVPEHEVYAREFARLQTELGVSRIFLTHCGIDMASRFRTAFGDHARLAVPGTCIPLSPPSE